MGVEVFCNDIVIRWEFMGHSMRFVPDDIYAGPAAMQTNRPNTLAVDDWAPSRDVGIATISDY